MRLVHNTRHHQELYLAHHRDTLSTDLTIVGDDMGLDENTDAISKTLAWLSSHWMPVVLGIAIITAAGFLLYAIVQAIRHSRVRHQYGAKIPAMVRISHSRPYREIGSFILDYPEWSSPKKDGTRDLRTNNMRVVKNRSVLEIGGWALSGKDPFVFYDMVNGMRTAGATIAYCPEEQSKRSRNLARIRSHRQATTVDGIIAQFSSRPTDFEPFCADLFRHLGYQATTTPPTRDGGFDIRLRRHDGVTFIAECKCYDRTHHVGRPTIQKLRGANTVERADEMMVITTSSFSQEATVFAQQVGVQLIDGHQLVALCQQAWGDSQPPSIMPGSNCLLTRNDIMARIPKDMRERY